MKQYTDYEQTHNLVAWGFPVPLTLDKDGYNAYTIGGLIELMEGDNYIEVRRTPTRQSYGVICYHRPSRKTIRGCKYRELVDALYAMIITLIEEHLIYNDTQSNI